MRSRRKKSGRSIKKPLNLSKTVLEYVRGKRYTPSTLSELSQQLNIPSAHTHIFKQTLDDLVEKGEIVLNQTKYRSPISNQLKTGTINVLPKGFGFVRVDKGADVFIARPHLKGAVDGDTVEVEILAEASPKGPEGKVVAILKRSRTHLAGTILRKIKKHYIAYAPLLGVEKPVQVHSKLELEEGDRVICQVKTWKNKEGLVDAEVTRNIGNISDPSIDIQAAVEEFELPDGFTQEAIDEAKQYGKAVLIDPQRKDLTTWEIVTIDPDTAKDFDDAISLTKDPRGHFFLGVHIADVAHYVKPYSHLDKAAYLRCNSTYFPGTCIPMLPEELSNELCSLKPHVPRLTQSVFMEFTPQGDLVNYSIERSCIHSQKRFTYNEALEVLEHRKNSPHASLLHRMVELCGVLKKKRFERGSIDFSLPSSTILVDKKGVPQKIEKVEYDITHQMIEEFMLKANETVATHLSKKGLSLIYRIHEEPSLETFEDFYQFAKMLGFQLPNKPLRKDIQELFEQAKHSPHLSQLSISFIRSMKLAAYSTDNLGHYGLALEHYCHFTSPIRRYTDLMIQRLLFQELPKDFNLEAVATACSEKERVSFRAESSVTILKKLRFAATFYQEDPTRIYEAIVTKIKPFALFFEVPLFDLEGQVHVSNLGNDYFEYRPESMSFKGTRTGKLYQMGQKLSVRLEEVDFVLLQSAWALPDARKKKCNDS